MNKTPEHHDGAAAEDDLFILDELTEGEDEFDVDLMACGCRVAPTTKMNLGIEDVLNLFGLDEDQKSTLIGALIDEAKVSPDRFLEMADLVSRGEVVEASKRPGERASLVKKDKKKSK